MGNTYRSRPKFKVGDIVEEYYWDIDRYKEHIDTYLVTEVKYVHSSRLKNNSYRVKMKRRNGPKSCYRRVYRWTYTILNIETGEVETFGARALDRSVSKKVG
jgi:hypothetical protein